MKPAETQICGMAAVRALFDRAPDSIVRLFFDAATGRQVGRISKYLAQKKRVYRMVPAAELEKIAGTVHHGGIVAITESQPIPLLKREQLPGWATERRPVLILDRIGNPHNLGAIVRTAAFLGVADIILPEHPAQAFPSDASYRVAEGGMEHVRLHRVPSLVTTLRELGKYFEIFGAALGGAKPLNKVLDRTARSRPVALVLGNEEHGIAPEVLAECHQRVMIPGTGKVESLNVSAAGAILMWALWKNVGENLQR